MNWDIEDWEDCVLALARLVLQATGFLAILVLIIGIGAFLTLGPWLQYKNKPEKADIIIPLGGDQLRLVKAAELYKQGFAQRILLGNVRVEPPSRIQRILVEMGYPQIGPSEFEIRLLVHLGVPRSAIEWFGKQLGSTAEEAEALRDLLHDKSTTIILVTSPYQARRAKIIFEREMPQVQWLIVWPTEERLPRPWWSEKNSAMLSIMEVAKLLNYFAGSLFRDLTATSS